MHSRQPEERPSLKGAPEVQNSGGYTVNVYIR